MDDALAAIAKAEQVVADQQLAKDEQAEADEEFARQLQDKLNQ
jgi:hypothetical protein